MMSGQVAAIVEALASRDIEESMRSAVLTSISLCTGGNSCCTEDEVFILIIKMCLFMSQVCVLGEGDCDKDADCSDGFSLTFIVHLLMKQMLITNITDDDNI